MTGSRWWPAALVGVLAVTVVANVAVYWKANHDPSFAVEPDYYQQAVDWDSTVARRARSAALGWQATVSLSPPEAGSTTMRVQLADARGLPLDSADVRVTASHNAHGADPRNLRLLAAGPGLYAVRFPATAQGLWRVDLSAVRGPDQFVERLTVDNGTPTAP